uniref:Uncharacterized protein n=1 Tax=Anopheles albimanus TaxID=7167 RepID=A0A182F962_ANOAL
MLMHSDAGASPRSGDIFEISPRPFSVTPSANSGFQYVRSPPRSELFSNGLTASRNFPGTATATGTRQLAASSQRKSPFGTSGGFGELITTETPPAWWQVALRKKKDYEPRNEVTGGNDRSRTRNGARFGSVR